MALKVAIVGGGPGGLTLARLLHCKGIEFTVFERSVSATSNLQGGSLDIHENDGQLALREAGLYEEFLKKARTEDDVFTLYDEHGKCFGGLFGEPQDAPSQQPESGRPEIDRTELRQILLDSIPERQIRWESNLKRINNDAKCKRVLEFANGDTACGFDLIVGADGAFSKVRPFVNSLKPEYSGKYYIEAKVSPDSPAYQSVTAKLGNGTIAFLGGPKQVMMQRQGDASYRIYFGVTVPEDFVSSAVDLADGESTRRLLLSPDFFGDWCDTILDIIRNCSSFRSWPLYSMNPERLSWTSVPGITLMGDAAHVSVPAGEGVNVAMLDALVLAKKLDEFGKDDLDRAVREYEHDMLARGKAMIEESWETVRMMAHPDGPSAVIQAFRLKIFGA
ncbi:hypothetical protein S40293_08634 [Stachybotrys chartarum IBT 40293]|nr:hypothetical protein S40293_08634 [Stachybotrys chartarum IBT 40293]